jgi:hypothetical protein
MKSLYEKLASLGVVLNSNYGNSKALPKIYEETYRITKKIHQVKNRIVKIKKVFNERY